MIDGDVMGVTVPSAIILGGEVSGGRFSSRYVSYWRES